MARVKCPKCDLANPAGQAVCTRCHTALPRVSIEARSGPPPLDMREVSFRRGQMIANRYTVIDLIGRGGMGCIYRVRDNALNDEVALKTLLPQFARDKVVVERFYNEARIARQLTHTNIVRVHDIGNAGNVIYISMEYLKGKSLRAVLDSLIPGQRLPIRTVLRILDELCKALEYAHQYTVHRDIKPENIMILPDGTVKLMDFGISKLMTHTRFTAASVVMGTPYYMSPEQLKDSGAVDARADIYSVGVVLYEMLSGNVPTGVIKPASQIMEGVPPALDPLVAKCVEPDPRNRFASATELREALRPIRELVESGTPFHATTAKTRNRAGLRRAAGVAALVALLAASAAGYRSLEQRRLTTASAPVAQAAETTSTAPSAARFAAVADILPDIRARAEAAASTEGPARAYFTLGNTFWQRAQAASNQGDPRAEDLAWHAVQCYVGAFAVPPGMVFVPPGIARIATSSGEAEVPVDGFFIDAYEVTNAEYLRFVQREKWRPPAYESLAAYFAAASTPGAYADPSGMGFFRPAQPEIPVTMVSFYDAQAYAAWARKKLPTEAQWVRAASNIDGQLAPFPWGDAPEPGATNTADPADEAAGPVPPGRFERDRSPFGCMDMAGNVAEWTRSFFSPTPEPDHDLVPRAAGPLPFNRPLVVRGESYLSAQAPLAQRYPVNYQDRLPNVGFRCVVEIPRDVKAVRNGV